MFRSAPLLVDVQSPDTKSSAIRFLNVWTKHHSFMNLVRDAWNIQIDSRPMVKFAQKLNLLRHKLRSWKYGNIHRNVRKAEDEVLTAELACDQDPSEANKRRLCQLQQALNEKLETKKTYGSKELTSSGSLKGTRTQNFSTRLSRIGGKNCISTGLRKAIISAAEIELEALEAYQSQLNGNFSSQDDTFLNSIPKLISEEDNNIFWCVPAMDEVRDIILEINGNSTAGLDGNNGHFCSYNWDIIK